MKDVHLRKEGNPEDDTAGRQDDPGNTGLLDCAERRAGFFLPSDGEIVKNPLFPFSIPFAAMATQIFVAQFKTRNFERPLFSLLNLLRNSEESWGLGGMLALGIESMATAFSLVGSLFVYCTWLYDHKRHSMLARPSFFKRTFLILTLLYFIFVLDSYELLSGFASMTPHILLLDVLLKFILCSLAGLYRGMCGIILAKSLVFNMYAPQFCGPLLLLVCFLDLMSLAPHSVRLIPALTAAYGIVYLLGLSLYKALMGNRASSFVLTLRPSRGLFLQLFVVFQLFPLVLLVYGAFASFSENMFNALSYPGICTLARALIYEISPPRRRVNVASCDLLFLQILVDLLRFSGYLIHSTLSYLSFPSVAAHRH
jgi:hypothetical protein